MPFDGRETPAIRRWMLIEALRAEMPPGFTWDFTEVNDGCSGLTLAAASSTASSPKVSTIRNTSTGNATISGRRTSAGSRWRKAYGYIARSVAMTRSTWSRRPSTSNATWGLRLSSATRIRH